MPYRPKGSRNWHYDFQIRGRRFHGSCGTSDFEEAKAVEAEARVAAKTAHANRKRFTVSEALGTYWSEVCRHQSSASTAKSQAAAILKAFKGKTSLHDLTTAELARMVSRMRAHVADSTVNRRLDMLARSIRYMVSVYEAEAAEIDWKALKGKEPAEIIRELTFAEERRLFEHLRQDLHPLVKFALMTGKRRAEICGLQWRQVDLEGGRIRFKVKGGRIHAFPINAEIRALLSAQPRSNVMATRAFVFTYLGEDGERRVIPSSGGHVWKLWRAALKEAEIEDFRFHDLRHTFATRLLRQCQNLKLVSRLLGHAGIESTMRYAHVLDEDLAATMETFSGLSPEETPEAQKKA